MEKTLEGIKKTEYSYTQLVRDLYRFLKPHRVKIFIASVIRVASDIVWLYPPYALATVINYVAAYHTGVSLHSLWVILVLFILASVIRFLGGYVGKMLMFSLSERMDVDAQLAAITHMFNLDIAWHEKENTGNKLKKIVRGSDDIDRILRIWINDILPTAVSLIGTAIIIARFDRTIAFFSTLFVITYYVAARWFRGHASRASVKVNKQEEELEGILFESLNNIRTVKVLGMAQTLHALITGVTEDLYQKVLKRIFWFQASGYSLGFYAQMFQISVLAFIVYGILHGQYAVGFLVLFWGYFGNLLSSVASLANVNQDLIVAKLSIGRMFEVFAEPVTIDSSEGKVSFPSDWKKISFKNVSFGYGENAVLHDVCFDINRGEKVGIIGLSGAGKSTIFKLLLKEHESYTGDILVDDVPLRSIEKRNYFNYSAVVLQDTEVFNFSLKENITLANNAESENESLLHKAITTAHVDDFIARLPSGVDTLIGEKGVKLSGGERQRVGIARAVFKDPQLLLLDEATSHLDIESEEKIRLSLHEFFQSVTAVVIAHRLTTIKEMDRIIVLEGGTILEEGTFDALYAKQGRFYDLWEKQSL